MVQPPRRAGWPTAAPVPIRTAAAEPPTPPPRSHSGRKPPRSMRWRDCAQRFRIREAFGVRLLAGASKQRTAAGDLLPHFCFPQRRRLSGDPTTHTVGGTSSTPARGWAHPNGWHGPADGKAPPAELLLPAAAEVAGERQKTETRPRVRRFPSTVSNPSFEQPSTFARFVPVRAVGMLRDHASLWALLPGAFKK